MTTFILIHGGWCGAWAWNKVVAGLTKKGIKALAPDLPGHGQNNIENLENVAMNEYVDYLRDYISRIDGKVVLVAHSMTGFVIAQLVKFIAEKIEKLVFFAAFMPEKSGDKINDYIAADPHTQVSPKTIVFKTDKLCTFDMRYGRNMGFNLTSDADFFQAAAQMQLENSVLWGQSVELTPQYDIIPKFYIHTLKDNCLSYFAQLRMCAKTPVYKQYYINSSHTAMISFPDESVEVLADIAAFPLQMM